MANTVVDDINVSEVLQYPVENSYPLQTLCHWIEEHMAKAQRDNDYIYHQDVPPIPALEIIEPANLVNSAILGGLRDPQNALNGEDALFGTLTSWGARMAIGKTSVLATRLVS